VINKRIKGKSSIGALRSAGGELVVDDYKRANIFNQYFTSVCITDDGLMPSIERAVPCGSTLDTIVFTPRDVAEAIRKVKDQRRRQTLKKLTQTSGAARLRGTQIQLRGLWERCQRLPSGVWGGTPAEIEIEFGAF
jgi:hypothetical protein